jgi:hypothetical protein
VDGSDGITGRNFALALYDLPEAHAKAEMYQTLLCLRSAG